MPVCVRCGLGLGSSGGLCDACTRDLHLFPSSWRPAVPAGRSRPGAAGIEGFDGAGAREFSFAVGSVRGLRQWDFPVSRALNRCLDDDRIPPGPGVLLTPDDPPLLKGVTGGRWTSGVNRAHCNNHKEHVPPVEFDELHGGECGCGYWAYWTPRDMQDWRSSLPVWGIVEGSGRVLIGEKGFRCQRARILALVPAFSVCPVQRNDPRPGLRELGESWMAVLMDVLGTLYPEARVFATVRGMLASFPTGEVTP